MHLYKTQGKLVEKYDVVNPDQIGGGGEYELQDGFGWTNGVLMALLSEDKEPPTDTPAESGLVSGVAAVTAKLRNKAGLHK